MRAINKTAKNVMDILTRKCPHLGDHDKFHTDPFMDVSVEYIDDCELGSIYSVAHYYEQNRNLLRDPEMCFIKGGDGEYYPYYYRQDGLGIEEDNLWRGEKGQIEGFDFARQNSHAIFAGTWMRNINQQQDEIK